MGNKYIDIIIKIIASKAKEYSVNNSLSPFYFMNLLPEIKDSITAVIKVYGYSEIDEDTLRNYYETAKNQYLSVNPIDIDPSNILTQKGFRTWLTAERKEEMKNSWNYTNRYFSLLENKGRSEKVINETKKTSLEILGKMGDPKSREEFYVKGLVVGSVQAGKTENFNGVINRAIDSGYKLIIVLAGLMEDLRNQTQVRINSDIVGEGEDIQTGRIKDVGVGEIRKFGSQGDESVVQIISVTSAKSDFKKSLLDADFSLNQTNILVCKNNVSVLRNLIIWLHDYLQENKDQHNIPLLILDDEADNASLNNEGKKGREYASKTNLYIRILLALFKKKTYLGYTATPFANILADRNEAPENNGIVKYKLRGETKEKSLSVESSLFPDDFIVLLNPPTNYIGAKQIFETIKPIDNKAELKIPLVEIVDDNITHFPDKVYSQGNGELMGVQKITSQDDWNEKIGQFNSYLDFVDYGEYRSQTWSSRPNDGFPRKLPDSIKESILCFILSIAIRESRKPAMVNSTMFNLHNSMLIHISRYTLWQNRLKGLIDVYVRELQSSLQLDDPTNPTSIYATFERIWFKYYSIIIEHVSDYLPKGYEDEFMKPISFETIKRNNFLTDAIKGIEVIAVNSSTGDKLVYPRNIPKKYIAIGGNRLSRGFTLEGLSINYFIRSTDYSDALLQMGRWFGYRPGYLDCCKLFITSDSMEKYNLVTRTIEELEIEFKKMEQKDKTPANFILRIKKHPGVLKITRPSILRDTKEVNWSYQDELVQTAKFNIRKEKIEKVFLDFKNNISSKFQFKPIFRNEKNNPSFLIAETDIDGMIQVLKLENNFDVDIRDSIIRFIEKCKSKSKLRKWTIAIKATGDAKSSEAKGVLSKAESGLPYPIGLTIRRGPKSEQASKTYRDDFLGKKIFTASGKSANIISTGLDFSILLNEKQITAAENEFINDRRKYYQKKYPEWSQQKVNEHAEKVTIPERVYREKMSDQEGLLVVYILDSYYVFNQERGAVEDTKMKAFVENEGIDLNIPLIGYAIGFPPIEPDPGGVYVHGNYGFEDEEDIEFNEEDSELPDDANEL